MAEATEHAYRSLRLDIDHGVYGPGARLPGERDLAERLGVSRVTTRRALARLATEGRLESSAQRGWFVPKQVLGEPPSTLQSFTEMVRARGLRPTTSVLRQEVRPATFEEADELERCVIALEEAIGRMRQTVVAIWYPIKDERQLRRFYQGLERSKAPKLLRVELLVHPADSADRLNGSGLAIANPPWPLEDELRELLPWLAEVLAQSEGGWRLDWLIEEAASGKL